MKIIKKYTAIQLKTETVNDDVNVKLTYGKIEGPYYSRDYPIEEFDTEDEAIEYAYNLSYCSLHHATLKIIKFYNWYN